jgi:hypothetical protein
MTGPFGFAVDAVFSGDIAAPLSGDFAFARFEAEAVTACAEINRFG